MVLQRRGRAWPDRAKSQDKTWNSDREPSGFSAIITGLIASILAMIVIFLIIGVYGFHTSSDIASLGTIALSGTMLAIAFGGFKAGKKAGKRGLIYGGLIGIIFAIIAVSVGIGGEPSAIITVANLKRIILSIVAGSVGGMLGVALS
ncbi:MAG: TIGR04086 family membrane protein [Firmicutes bacterium]|nr:TIGR04086 family membrane protein [Bacillota bacterium]